MRLPCALATATVLINSCCQLLTMGASLRVFLSKPHQNCTWLPLESSLITFELTRNSSPAALLPDGPACSALLTPDQEFGQRAENFVFRIVNRHLICQLSVQVDDLLNNKSLSLCSWPDQVFQTSLSVRLFTSGEPSAEPAEFQRHSDTMKADLPLLTAAAFYRPHICDEFKCRSSRICIPTSASCDGLAQCPDLSDESSDKEDNACFQYNSDSFSRIGIILTSALLISVGLVFAAVIRRTLLERLKKPSKYEVNPGKEVQYTECETSFMAPELDAF